MTNEEIIKQFKELHTTLREMKQQRLLFKRVNKKAKREGRGNRINLELQKDMRNYIKGLQKDIYERKMPFRTQTIKAII